MQKKEVIRLDNVYKFYKMGESVVKALNGLSIVVNKKEFVAIMGPSGSGKSTCMNLVGSLDTPTKGTVYLDGQDISKLSESNLAQIRGRKIGFIFQSFNLIPNLTAKENVILPMIFQGISGIKREKKARDLLTLVGLKERVNHYPNQLSGGERQRVAIARSLANDPEVILADEPTGNLDSKTGDIVMKFLNKLNKQGKTIVMVTHDEDLAKKHAEKIYHIRDGKIEKITKGKRFT